MYGYDVFHEEQLKKLISSVRENYVQHAYIFEGEEGVGKKKAAKLFAASLVCVNQNRAPCGACGACIGAKADTNPDIKYINSGDKKSIGVDLMRGVVSDAYIKPFESRKKVYIIEGTMTEQAQNSFLKMLEEPPDYAVFVILVQSTSQLLQTVISRCAVVRFRPIKKEVLKEYVKKKYPGADADFLANYAGGNVGRADKIMNSEGFFPLREAAARMLAALFSSHKISAFKIADFAEENKEFMAEIVRLWQSMVRDIILIKEGAENIMVNTDMKKGLKELAGKTEAAYCVRAEETFGIAEEMLERYANLNARAARAIALYLSFTIKKGHAI